MNIHVKGKKSVNLTQREFIASGGQGSVYALGGVAYKIYNDPSKMIPARKFQELSVLSASNIIRPLDILMDSHNKEIGYSMKHVQHTNALCQIFTKAYRDRNKITNDTIVDLVQNMQQTIKHVHDQKILIVDLNEMNFLVDGKFKEIFFIDVDSYQTPTYPATVIMESIRDRHCKGNWNENTDWFSFGIVSFQMFVGIHPYKGKHPTLNGFDERMLANASVFRKDVTYPKVVLPFNVIPQNYLDWYKAIFEDGKRIPPPKDLVATIVLATVRKISGTNNFDIAEVYTFSSEIFDYANIGGVKIAFGKDIYINQKQHHIPHQGESFVCITPKFGKAIAAWIDNNGLLALYDIVENKQLTGQLHAEQLMTYNGRLYFKNGAVLNEMQWIEGKTLLAAGKAVANVHENATKLHDGVAIQNLLGKYWATITPESNKSYNIALPEISGQVIDAKYDNNILMVIASQSKIQKGKKTANLEYTRFVYRFADNYSKYDVKQATVNNFVPLNFVVLDNGICCAINEDENIVLYRNKKDDSLVKIIDDPAIGGDIRLCKDGNQVMFIQNNTLYTLKMKP